MAKKNHQNNCPVPNGALVIIGGAEDRGKSEPELVENEINSRLGTLSCIQVLTEKRKPSIEIVTTASELEPDVTFQEYKKAFTELGFTEIGHIHHVSRQDFKSTDLVERVENASAVFFSGGDQLRLTSIYGGTDFLLALKERYIHDNLVIAGTSAGAMALSTPMIYQGAGRDELIAGNVKIATGMEFLRDVCIDTHFVHRGRLVRMAQVLAMNPSCIGVGIEEDTALIVRNGSEAEATGRGVVIVVRANRNYGTNILSAGEGQLLSIRGLEVDILSKGESFLIPEFNPPHK